MTAPLKTGSDLWWRFSQYELRDGYIRPAPGAALGTFDPWAHYHAARDGRGTGQPPYVSLLNLLDTLPSSPAVSMTAACEAKLLAWCNEYGLLGVLLQRTHMVTIASKPLTPDD